MKSIKQIRPIYLFSLIICLVLIPLFFGASAAADDLIYEGYTPSSGSDTQSKMITVTYLDDKRDKVLLKKTIPAGSEYTVEDVEPTVSITWVYNGLPGEDHTDTYSQPFGGWYCSTITRHYDNGMMSASASTHVYSSGETIHTGDNDITLTPDWEGAMTASAFPIGGNKSSLVSAAPGKEPVRHDISTEWFTEPTGGTRVTSLSISKNSTDKTLYAREIWWPTIYTQPEDASAGQGETVTFSVAATDGKSYRWQSSSDDGWTWTDIDAPTADTANFELKASRQAAKLVYRCAVTNDYITEYSADVGLTLTSSAEPKIGDINGDGDILADDARIALRASAKLTQLTEEEKKLADVDGSGDVMADDARQILRYSARLQDSFKKFVPKTYEPLEDSRVTLSKDEFTCNGKVQKPSVTVKNAKNKKLTEGKDYTLSWSGESIAAGIYSVTVTGKGDYKGEIIKDYTLSAIPLEESWVTLSKNSFDYNGKEQKPSVSVKNAKNTKLKDGTDYSLSWYGDSVDPGNYTVTVVGEGIYSGEVTKSYTIKPDVAALEAEVIRLVNAERAKYNLRALSQNKKLTELARKKAQEMHDKNYFSHTSPTYGSPFDMLDAAGVWWSSAAENIAYGSSTAQGVVDQWMNSQGHRDNILDSSYSEIGVGYCPDGDYWVQLFVG